MGISKKFTIVFVALLVCVFSACALVACNPGSNQGEQGQNDGNAGYNDGDDNINPADATPADEFEFAPYGDNAWCISEYTGDRQDIVIPTVYQNKRIEAIGAAFYGNESIRSVVIPESVTHIESFAFRGCGGLESVTFENTNGWQVAWYGDSDSYADLSSGDLSDSSTAATYLRSTYDDYYWRRV